MYLEMTDEDQSFVLMMDGEEFKVEEVMGVCGD